MNCDKSHEQRHLAVKSHFTIWNHIICIAVVDSPRRCVASLLLLLLLVMFVSPVVHNTFSFVIFRFFGLCVSIIVRKYQQSTNYRKIHKCIVQQERITHHDADVPVLTLPHC